MFDIEAYIDSRIAEALSKQSVAPTAYSQLDGQRPPGTSRNIFLVAWRILHKEGHPGATYRGKSRMLSPDAWQSYELRAASKPLRRRKAALPPTAIEVEAAAIRRKMGL